MYIEKEKSHQKNKTGCGRTSSLVFASLTLRLCWMMIVWRHLSNFKDTFVFTRYSQQKHMLIFFAFCLLFSPNFVGWIYRILFRRLVIQMRCTRRSCRRLSCSLIPSFARFFFVVALSRLFFFFFLSHCLNIFGLLSISRLCSHMHSQNTIHCHVCVCLCVFRLPFKKEKEKK